MLVAIFSSGAALAVDAGGKLKVLLVTGGHGFEKEPFFKVFQDNPAITFSHAAHGKTNATVFERDDLLTVTSLAHSGQLSLRELITHAELPGQAEAAYQTAFGDADCLKMILDWTHSA